MKIAIFGSGGVGGYFGAHLAAAEDVSFLARGAHLEAMREEGLRVRSANGDVHLQLVQATDDPGAIGPVDVVVVAVKLYDTEAAAAVLLPLVGPETAVVSLQNGVTAAETFGRAVGPEHVFGGVTYISAVIAAPGVIAHTGTLARLVVGELDNRRTARVEAFIAACQRVGLDAAVSDDISVEIWSKFTFLSAMSGVTSLLRLPLGPIREDTETRALFISAFDEAVAVARAKGIALPDDMVARHMARIDELPPGMGSSMLYDLSHGKRLELPWLSGTVVDLGRTLGVATPTHAFITTALKLHTEGAVS
ncbi:MAG: 2-dehydropantoate 2-reductase [Rhodospirillales bacterium]|nr:2-dehydropantoate 2-reductase [Rhodospirillales bacterium]